MDANITQSFIDMVEAYKAKPELESQIKQLRDDVEFFERNLRIEEDTSRSLREANANLYQFPSLLTNGLLIYRFDPTGDGRSIRPVCSH